jgi:hypothetical protein
MSLCCCHAAKTTLSRPGSDVFGVTTELQQQNDVKSLLHSELLASLVLSNLRKVQCLLAGPATSQYSCRWTAVSNMLKVGTPAET